MYESFFGLRKRPFAAAPDAEMLVETPAVVDAIRRLDRCVRQGCGVAVLTAAAGFGKTHLCHRLSRNWGDHFHTVLLPNTGFPTRRGLLQAVLAELGRPYQRLGETELRVELTAYARKSRAESRGIVLLFDEAHRYSERVLEEVHLIANLVEGGEPLVRVLLAGQLDLEDKLADPSLAGLNERVGELVTLPRLTAEESRQYLGDRSAFAGAGLAELFDPAAVELIARACGGVPRCLNQLADHSLLLGYVAERRPVREGFVREALEDLKRLPLHWHDPLPTVTHETPAFDVLPAGAVSSNVIEIGELCDPACEAGSLDRPKTTEGESPLTELIDIEMLPAPATVPSAPLKAPSPVGAEAVRDRYARLDDLAARRRWFEELGEPFQDVRRTEENFEQTAQEFVPAARSDSDYDRPVTAHSSSGVAVESRPAVNPLEILDRIEPLVVEALSDFDDRPRLPEPTAPAAVVQRVSVDHLVAALEPATAPPARPMGLPDRAATVRPSMMFSELRKRAHR